LGHCRNFGRGISFNPRTREGATAEGDMRSKLVVQIAFCANLFQDAYSLPPYILLERMSIY
ncbi:hypothetical protein, partial [Akkermansia sp.]|uniref:hypothetical protein n=1 Tax=Akkermansia sp. TaxID=1872421 RepID=UPI003AB884FD